MEILIKAAQFFLSLSLLIILHEMGHFIPAKLFKTRVEKFYLFFDPWFSIFKKKIGGTEYGMGWLPLGGYVKISGMVDESMDKEQMKQEPKPWEFRSKPAWQRLIIMVGGVTVNVILAILIYTGMMMHYGEEYLPNDNVTYGVQADSVAQSIGIQNGDKILSVDGKNIERFSEIPLEILLGEGGRITVLRDGREQVISITQEQKGELIAAKTQLVAPRAPFVVGGFSEESVAKKAGVEKGDSLVSFNGQEMFFFDQFIAEVPNHSEEEITLGFYRGNNYQEVSMTLPESGLMGLRPSGDFLKTEKLKYGFFEAIPAGIAKAGKVLSDYIRQFRLIFNPDTGAYKEVGGFLMIADQFDAQWNWERFWAFTAFLSIMLAFLNILPIPALDGGHVVFVLWEMITGRKPSEKVLEYAQVVGFVILLSLILVVNGNDVLKLFN